MKIRMKRLANGETERVEIAEPGDERAEDLDFRGANDDGPMTVAQRRAYLAALESTIEKPKENDFQVFLRYGRAGIEKRDQTTTTTAGGYIVPPSFIRTFLPALQAYDGIFDAASVVRTTDGSAAVLPLDDDSGQSAAVVAENDDSATDQDAVFDQIAFGKTETWRTGFLKASLEVVGDSAFDLSTLLAGAFARRFARGIGAAFVTTLLSSATSGKTATAAAAIQPDEILDLMESVDSAFGARGSFLMNSTTFLLIQKVKATGGGAYLAPIGVDAEGYPTLFSKRVYLSPSMPAATAGLTPVAFGDLSRFVRREVANSLSTKVFLERFALNAQVGYEGYWRVDGALAVAANSPIPVRYLTMAGS